MSCVISFANSILFYCTLEFGRFERIHKKKVVGIFSVLWQILCVLLMLMALKRKWKWKNKYFHIPKRFHYSPLFVRLRIHVEHTCGELTLIHNQFHGWIFSILFFLFRWFFFPRSKQSQIFAAFSLMTTATTHARTHVRPSEPHDLLSTIIIKSLILEQHKEHGTAKKGALAPLNWHLPHKHITHTHTHHLNNNMAVSSFCKCMNVCAIECVEI